jgi:uncharacterized protein (UPF0332 family)
MTRWRAGEADIEQLLRSRELHVVTGLAADGRPGLERARMTLVSAQALLSNDPSDPSNAFVLAYDAARHACTALLAQQGLRPTTAGGHIAVERAARAQFGASFAPYGALRRRRNDVEYPAHPGDEVDAHEAEEAITTADRLVEAADKLLPHLGLFGPA